MADGFEHLFSERARGLKASMIRELLKLTHQKDIVLFAGGLFLMRGQITLGDFRSAAEIRVGRL